MISGIFISWLLSIVGNISSFFTIHTKDAKLNEANNIIKNLEAKNHELELKYANLKGKVNESIDIGKTEESENPSVATRLRHRLNLA